MINFKEFLTEGKKITIYHGDNFNTTKLDPKLMANWNQQEGVGIYFDSLEVAKDYGNDIVSTEIDKKNFVYSRDEIKKYISNKKIFDLLKALHKLDNDVFFYYISDYIEVSEPEDVKDYHIKEFVHHIYDKQVRNFQVDMAEKFGVVNFVKLWNEIIKIDWTYNDEDFYAIINPKYKLEKY